jgi:tyramine---L-glutamate ligase
LADSGYDASVKIFVYEHMNGGALPERSDRESLRSEGRAMLFAVLADLQACPGVETVTLLDGPHSAPGQVVSVANPAEADSVFRTLARSADRTMIIAPETDGVLESRCRQAEEDGGQLLGPSAAAVRLTADKLALAAHLSNRGVPTPPTSSIGEGDTCPFPLPVVVKPRDGAGSEATTLIASTDEWRALVLDIEPQSQRRDRIVQPFVRGQAVSVALLVGASGIQPLPAAVQHLSTDGRFRYEGGSIPLPSPQAARAQKLARAAVAAVPGLKGFVGVDLVLSDGGGDAVIEINPRLTTSYVGLRALARFNLAAAILAACEGQPLLELAWRSRGVSWRPDGSVRFESS